MRACFCAAAIAAIGAACSSASAPTLSQSEVTGYNGFAQDLSSTVATYRAGASAMRSPSDCSAAEQQYMAHATPDIQGMTPIAAHMDGQLGVMSQVMSGDMSCGMSVAATELARHAAAACASADLAANRDEAAHHCDAMESFVEHMQMRSAETTQMMGSGGMMNGGMGSGSPDGGWTMPDGGRMGWDHKMPGCVFADGGFSIMDGGMPWLDGGSGMPGQDGGMPGQDAGMPSDGGMMDGGMR